MVIGGPGSGKSTLAREMGERLGLPVVHLDRVFWLPGWVERTREERVRLVTLAEAEERWIIDGNFTTSWPNRVQRADLIVWLDLPVPLRLWRVLRRIRHWRGRVRPDMQDGCPERLDPGFLWYIPSTARRYRRKCLALFAGLPTGKGIRLSSPAAIRQWRDGLPR
jgi:adenylate kinase family enzyme